MPGLLPYTKRNLKMKAMIFVCVFFVVLVGFCVYLEVSTRNFADSLPKAPTIKENPQDSTVPSVLEVDKPVPSFHLERVSENTETSRESAKNNEKPLDFDWKNDTAALETLEQESSDPFSDYLELQEAIERGTLITADTSGEELYNAQQNQMLEEFGDIPEVHTVMEFNRKFDSDAPISLDEKIEYQEALVKLYPNSTNKKTLAYYKWLYPRGNSPEDIGNINSEAITELRSMGISVKEELTESGYSVKISTK